MRTSVTGNWRTEAPDVRTARGRHDGFTLLEVLVVVTLVALLGAAVTLSLSARGDRALESAAESLRDAVNHAAEAAVLAGRAYGLFVREDGCRLAVFDGRQWQPLGTGGLTIEPPLRLRGDGVTAGLVGDGAVPQMVFLPDGTHQLGELKIENAVSGESWLIESRLGGRYDVRAQLAVPR